MDSSHCQQNILYSRLFKIKTYLINFKPPCQNISKVLCNGALLCRIAENFNWSSVASKAAMMAVTSLARQQCCCRFLILKI